MPRKHFDPIGMRQIPFRIHHHDKIILERLLKQDHLTFQGFAEMIVKAYMQGDRSIMGVVRDQQLLKQVPKDVQERYTLSQRERQLLLDSIEHEVNRNEIVPTK